MTDRSTGRPRGLPPRRAPYDPAPCHGPSLWRVLRYARMHPRVVISVPTLKSGPDKTLRPRFSVRIIWTTVAAILAPALAAQGPPATDIYLAELRARGGRLEIGTPLNATRRSGYDNQPF